MTVVSTRSDGCLFRSISVDCFTDNQSTLQKSSYTYSWWLWRSPTITSSIHYAVVLVGLHCDFMGPEGLQPSIFEPWGPCNISAVSPSIIHRWNRRHCESLQVHRHKTHLTLNWQIAVTGDAVCGEWMSVVSLVTPWCQSRNVGP